MKILVTGGSGFIGEFMVSELTKEGHEVAILTNDETYKNENHEVIHADITNRAEMIHNILPDFEQIYHLAGLLGTSELIEKAYDASMVNIVGTVNILDGARKSGAKVIHITKPNVWLNTYSITKKAGEDFAKMYNQEFGVPTISIKWFNVYGPGQSFHCQKAVPYFIKWALNGEDIQIWGDGEQTMDLIHAEDAVRATIALAKEKEFEGRTIDVGSGEETSVKELAQMVLERTDNKSKVIYLPMRAGETENTRLCADIGVLQRIGFKFNRQLDEGLTETVEWYRKNLK